MANNIHKALFILFFCLTGFYLIAQTQKSGEVGLMVGGTYYLGDLNRVPFKGTKIAAGAFYRHNFNTRYSFKGIGHVGFLGATGTTPTNTNISFNRVYGHLGAMGEFNFLPFIVNKKNNIYSTYLQAGLGILYYPQSPSRKISSIFIFDIPMGFGVKFNLPKRFTCGADYIMYKTFKDDIDYRGELSTIPPKYQNTYQGNKDWFSYFGIYLAYKIDYPEKCPAFN